MSTAKESKVLPAERDANGAPHLSPDRGNGSTIDPKDGGNGAPHLTPNRGNGDQRGEAT